MNLGQMKDSVYRRTGYTSDDPLVTPTLVVEALNEAAALIWAEADWPWASTSTTFNTAAGTATYAVPSDWNRTERIVDPDGYPLERADARQLEDEWGDERGVPRFFAVDNEKIVLRPIPDAVRTYTHEYVRTEKVLAADTEAFILPAQWHLAVVTLAEARVHEAGRNPERAAEAATRYEREWRARMVDERLRFRGGLRPRIRDGSVF
jgi:hypothetical protein